MAAGSMTAAEREAFLADVHVGVLAIDEPGRGPLALPVWYQFEDGKVVIGMSGTSLKARLLGSAGRATLTVQTETPPYQYVSVEGPVTISASQRDDLSMATRYLGPELGAWYAENNPSTDESVVVTITPENWRTMDFGKLMAAG
jgi:nitroimidazol reductase NimA-like FMN-containing flavoprotein (pyridoxamine 5'-phosphate oxidase superfamily)